MIFPKVAMISGVWGSEVPGRSYRKTGRSDTWFLRLCKQAFDARCLMCIIVSDQEAPHG